MYTIGQVSQMMDLPISTLRYYDKEGLIPGLERASGIRRFGPSQIEALHVIECLKKSGLELREIRQFMALCREGSSTYPQRKALFLRQKEQVEAEMARLRQTMAMIQFKCWYYDQAIQDGNEDRLQAMIPDHLPPEIQALYDEGHGEARETRTAAG